MRSFLIFTLSFLLAFAFDDFAMPDDDDVLLSGPNVVVDLTKDNFTQFIQQHPVVLAEFYAPW
jgi:protein disulfide-isomerase A1